MSANHSTPFILPARLLIKLSEPLELPTCAIRPYKPTLATLLFIRDRINRTARIRQQVIKAIYIVRRIRKSVLIIREKRTRGQPVSPAGTKSRKTTYIAGR